MTDRQQLVMEIEAVTERLNAALDSLSDEQASIPSADVWSIKDHLNHICVWHEMRALEIMRVSRGGMAAMPLVDDGQLEAINLTFADLRRRLPLAQVIADLDFARALVLSTIQSCPESGLDPGRYEELGLTGAGHDVEHIQAIEAWRKKEGI